MELLQMDDVRALETIQAEPGRLSALIVKLIFASREIEAKVYDSNPRTGNFVVVLEGTLDIGQRARRLDATTPAPEAGDRIGAMVEEGRG
ncbi:MAG TPA: hypothetical protein VFB95_12605 [Candidatus Cryosericum sp.]|nr:hypothetical protein [Candidatus Cryosericum sp.]